MTAAILALVPALVLAIGDRFELTAVAGPKLRPHAGRVGIILTDADDCWKVRFDGTACSRVIRKTFIQAERRR